MQSLSNCNPDNPLSHKRPKQLHRGNYSPHGRKRGSDLLLFLRSLSIPPQHMTDPPSNASSGSKKINKGQVSIFWATPQISPADCGKCIHEGRGGKALSGKRAAKLKQLLSAMEQKGKYPAKYEVDTDERRSKHPAEKKIVPFDIRSFKLSQRETHHESMQDRKIDKCRSLTKSPNPPRGDNGHT